MKLIIAGGRDYRLTGADLAVLDEYALTIGVTEVVSGGAAGVDSDGEAWAKSAGLSVKRFPADWKTHGRAAGPMRNSLMAAYADALIAFKGGKGTANMIRQARDRGLKVVEVFA